jgi:hypothetical protein
VVYDRRIDDKILNFEASGALMKASLVMRDREADSWWSIMTSTAVGGQLAGNELTELPLGEKTTWKEWVAGHPDTVVLSVDGREHEEFNPYADYFSSQETFRDLRIDDKRLAAKEPVYSFWIDGEPYAAPHSAFSGGRLFDLAGSEARVFLYRGKEPEFFASSQGFLVPRAIDLTGKEPGELLETLSAPAGQARPLEGFDTFWYTWIAVNHDSKLLR